MALLLSEGFKLHHQLSWVPAYRWPTAGLCQLLTVESPAACLSLPQNGTLLDEPAKDEVLFLFLVASLHTSPYLPGPNSCLCTPE